MAESDIIDSFHAMPQPIRVGLLLFPGCMPAGLFAFADLLHAANRRRGRDLFEATYVALQAGPVDCAHGVSLQAQAALGETDLDAVLVPGFWAESAEQVNALVAAQALLVKALSKGPRDRQLWAYCTGVCLLAACGRLDGQCATVTWWLAQAMQARYRKVRWQNERICVFNERNATASGVNGYLPLAENLIEKSLSRDALRDITRLMVLPRPAVPHAAFQGIALIQQPDGLLRRLHGLVERMPAEQITVKALADRLAMSERTLARKVGSETGQTVAAYARCIKLNQVGERLVMTSLPLASIGAELGFSSSSNLQRMFKALTGLTPMAYRRQFARV
ncbi:Transcriptional regulator GlxA family, contains an amidase domain and an AraC-type DNA-binding HTH domain [Pseudomonas sp. NFACC32-1]|nr:Transcriptional regulator GlxA family, contains an amidase domain and an AraC-type DNA-binding HTH domain [Pseudomonas sp. NFACC32-1]SFX23914.1 Transcriptional regulator GlxA family, contains an amidase domain and an AraC-type DNA-binding HTH domain [Pseudomonas sp. NFACC47-1]SFX53298.1 Transcriptional regulator GlxA family, contains an amidase domain and an AraC-type DNA-binding HTH domain [Pseudomonas sp. NFACC43]